jgi:hypothetical protein
MLRPGIPEKAIKGLSARNKRDPRKINKQDLIKRIGGLITSQPIMFMGTYQHDIAIIWLPRQGSDLWLHGQGKGGLIMSQPYHLCERTCG